MKIWAFVVCSGLLFASCNSILSSKPMGTLSENKMTDVLVDINLTEGELKIANDSLVRLKDTTELRKRFALVFEKNDVDPDDFNASLSYYLQHIDELDKIYTEVINRLTTIEATLLAKSNSENNLLNKLNTNNLPYMSNNIWYRMMIKNTQPEENMYFDASKFQPGRKVKPIYPGPLR